MRPNLQKTADLVTFTEEFLNDKLHFLRIEANQTYLNFLSTIIILILTLTNTLPLVLFSIG